MIAELKLEDCSEAWSMMIVCGGSEQRCTLHGSIIMDGFCLSVALCLEGLCFP